MECNVVSIWASFDWNVSKVKRGDETTKRCDLLFDLKIHTFRLSFFNILFNSGREHGLSFYEINRKK